MIVLDTDHLSVLLDPRSPLQSDVMGRLEAVDDIPAIPVVSEDVENHQRHGPANTVEQREALDSRSLAPGGQSKARDLGHVRLSTSA